MSRLFPHTYAEDQPFSKTILYTHCLTRGLQAGALVGSAISVPIYIYPSRSSAPAPKPSFLPLLLKSSGRGALIGTAAMALAVPARMYGRDTIEWQDRSWRLLENKGQLECDDWTYSAIGLSAVGAVGLRQAPSSRIAVVGSIGLGSVVGMVGYMGWRYGIKGGEFEDMTMKEIVV